MLASKQRCWRPSRDGGRQVDIQAGKQRCWQASRDAGGQAEMLASKQRCWRPSRDGGRQVDIQAGKQIFHQASRDAGRQVIILADRRENVQVAIKIFRQANVGQAGRYSLSMAIIKAGGKIFRWANSIAEHARLIRNQRYRTES